MTNDTPRVDLSARWQRGLVLLGFGLITVLIFIGLGAGLGDGDEAIYAQNIREMLRSGDYGQLMWQGADVFQRPSAPYVFYAFFARFIPGEFGLRFGLGVCTLVTLVLLYFFARRIWGQRDTAMLVVVSCLSIPSFYEFCRILQSDAPFVAFLVVALGSTVLCQRDPRWIVGAGLGLGGAFAMKSFAAGIPGLAIAPWVIRSVWIHRAWRPFLGGTVGFLVLALPFWVYGLARHGHAFIEGHAFALFSRTSGKLLVGDGGFTIYAEHLYTSDGVGTVIWVVAAIAVTAVVGLRRRSPELGVLVTWSLVTFVVLSLMGTRLVYYLLPFYPGAALCCGAAYSEVVRPRLPTHVAAPAALAVAAALVVVSLQRPTPHVHLLPSVPAQELGPLAQAHTGPADKVYALEWYAPAFGFYADRPVEMWTESDAFFDNVDNVDFIHAAGAVRRVPICDAPASFVIAGLDLHRPWLEVEEVLGTSQGGTLARARISQAGQDACR